MRTPLGRQLVRIGPERLEVSKGARTRSADWADVVAVHRLDGDPVQSPVPTDVLGEVLPGMGRLSGKVDAHKAATEMWVAFHRPRRRVKGLYFDLPRDEPRHSIAVQAMHAAAPGRVDERPTSITRAQRAVGRSNVGLYVSVLIVLVIVAVAVLAVAWMREQAPL